MLRWTVVEYCLPNWPRLLNLACAAINIDIIQARAFIELKAYQVISSKLRDVCKTFLLTAICIAVTRAVYQVETKNCIALLKYPVALATILVVASQDLQA